MKAFSILFLVSMCISSSCSKSVVHNNSLEGTWILKQISGGYAGRTTAPDKKTTITFQSPNEYSTNYDNQPADAGNYITAKPSEPNYYYTKMLKLFSNTYADTLIYYMHIGNDSLVLNEGCCDRFAYTYTRQK